MPEKFYITKENKVAIQCPSCGKTKLMDAAKYKYRKTVVKGSIKCPCGKTFSFILERRKCYRKSTRLSGKFEVLTPYNGNSSGTMIVKDISKTGLQIKPMIPIDLKQGDKLLLDFRLDDQQQTKISLEAIVMSTFSENVGLQFCTDDAADPNIKAIGFYLF